MDKESDCAEVVTLELILMLHTGDILVNNELAYLRLHLHLHLLFSKEHTVSITV